MAKDARLVSIHVNKDNPWAMLAGAEEIGLEGAGALIKSEDVEPGKYGLAWNFVQHRETGEAFVRFDLNDGKFDSPADTLLLPTIPYFSGPTVAHNASGIFNSSKALVKALVDMFPEYARGTDPLKLANEFMSVQSRAFETRMNQWIDFEGEQHKNALGNLSFMIGSSFSMYSMVHPVLVVDRPLVVLPESPTPGLFD